MPNQKSTRAAQKAQKKRPITPEEQHARFVEVAKQVGVDESPGAMEKAFKKIDPRRTQSDKNTKL